MTQELSDFTPPSIGQQMAGTAVAAASLEPFIARNRNLFRTPSGEILLVGHHTRRAFRSPGPLIDHLVGNGLLEIVPAAPGASVKAALGAQIMEAALPELRGMVRADCLYFDRTAGTWAQLAKGYHPGGVLCDGPVMPLTSGAREPDDYDCLRELFSGLNCTTASKQLLECLLALMVGRAGLPEFPLIMIDATEKNAGKTRTARAMITVLGTPNLGAINDRKRLNQQAGTIAWQPGPNVLFADNVSGKIFGETFSAAVHEEHLTVEPKFQGMSKIFYPIILFTLNEGKVEHDLHDKSIWVQLKRDPAAGAAVRFDPDPQTYAESHRLAILDDCRRVLLHAQAPTRDSIDPQTRFIDWERALIGVATELGYTLDLTPPSAQVRDQLTLDLLNALDHFIEAHDGKWPTTQDIVTVIRSFPRDYADANYVLKGVTSARGRARKLNTILKRIAGIPLTNDGECCMITLTDDKPTRIRKETT